MNILTCEVTALHPYEICFLQIKRQKTERKHFSGNVSEFFLTLGRIFEIITARESRFIMNSSELIYSGIPTLSRDKSGKYLNVHTNCKYRHYILFVSRFNKFFRFPKKFFGAKYRVLLKADRRSEFTFVYLSILAKEKKVSSLPLLAEVSRKKLLTLLSRFVYMEINFSMVYMSANKDFFFIRSS